MLIVNYSLSFFLRFFFLNNKRYLIHTPATLFSVCLSYINFHLVSFIFVESRPEQICDNFNLYFNAGVFGQFNFFFFFGGGGGRGGGK